jgi:hypothetical protein
MGDYPKPQQGLDLVDKSNLTYLIPRATDFDINKFFKDQNLPHESLLDSIEQRESLFFGEPSLLSP